MKNMSCSVVVVGIQRPRSSNHWKVQSWRSATVCYQGNNKSFKKSCKSTVLDNNWLVYRTIKLDGYWNGGNAIPGVVFSHKMPKMDFYYSHCFSWGKNTLNWYIKWHSYINYHHSLFIGHIKIDQKNYPPWTMEVLKWNVFIPS